MKFVPNKLSSTVGRQVLKTQKHSPTILFAAGVVGVVGATVLACRATLKLDEVLEEAQTHLEDIKRVGGHNDYTEQDRKKDVATVYIRTGLDVFKLYAPAIAVGSLSIAALTGSHNILTKRNASLTAAYATVDKAFDEYRKRVAAEFGDEKEREIRYAAEDREIVEETDKGPKVTTVKQPGTDGASMYARFFDETCQDWSPQQSYNQQFIQCQQNWANDLLNARGHVFLNEVYDMLGMPRTPEGQIVGWVKGHGDDYIDFGIFSDIRKAQRFINGDERSILLDFNVDGPVWELI